MATAIKWPTDTQRVTIIGKTGSGKTQAAAWLLSRRSYTKRPWIVLDFKGDEIIGEIPLTDQMGVRDKMPKYPGIYIVNPVPGEEDDVEALMWKIWAHERVGVYIDEGYMIPKNSKAFQAILTQGRSKEIPVIMLTQRPTLISRFAFTEADYIQLFQLTDSRDKKTVKEFMPMPIDRDLPAPYYSWWYDNARSYKTILQPVPQKHTILDRFYERLTQRRRVL